MHTTHVWAEEQHQEDFDIQQKPNEEFVFTSFDASTASRMHAKNSVQSNEKGRRVLNRIWLQTVGVIWVVLRSSQYIVHGVCKILNKMVFMAWQQALRTKNVIWQQTHYARISSLAFSGVFSSVDNSTSFWIIKQLCHLIFTNTDDRDAWMVNGTDTED